MTKETVNIHVIHSMKGGCGKSTCALSKLLELSNRIEEDESSRAKVLFVDVDFRGSALQWLLFRKNAEKKTELLEKHAGNIEKGNGLKHCFAMPDNYVPRKNLSQYLQGNVSTVSDVVYRTFTYDREKDLKQGNIGQEEQDLQEVDKEKIYINGYVDLVLSSSENMEKEAFRHNFENDTCRMPTLTAGIFRYRITTFLNNILSIGQVGNEKVGQYSEVVIDMPPSYDEYSDILLMVLKKIAQEKEQIKLHYYAVTTDDAGHLHLTLNNLKEERTGTSRCKEFETVNVILNSVMSEDFEDWSTKKEISDLWNIVQGKGKMYIKEHEKAYHKFCQDISCQEFPMNAIQEVKKTSGGFRV